MFPLMHALPAASQMGQLYLLVMQPVQATS
jgi:hypothetical protein